ncbi:MAG: xanthine dehydrogenase family protein subunit M [Acidobacteriota bacterium]|jgi:xanthine dehydrogenase YagS FAD-binding subunit
MLPDFTYVRPESLDQAIHELASSGARLHAGGTDLLGCLRDGIFTAEKIVSISGLTALRGIGTTSDGGLRIGALTTLAEIASHEETVRRYAALAQAAASAASPQLRNQGTLGGNLCQRPRCWYFRGDFHCLRKGGDICYAVEGENEYHCIFGGLGCYMVHPSDTAPALVALGARARVAGPDGTRIVSLEEFFVRPEEDVTKETVLRPDEILSEILLPAPAEGFRSLYRKVRARGAWDFALAGIALAVGVQEGRVQASRAVLSGVAPVPWRVTEVEQAITGRPLNAETAAAAAASLTGAEPLAHNGYKVDVCRGLIEEALLSLA